MIHQSTDTGLIMNFYALAPKRYKRLVVSGFQGLGFSNLSFNLSLSPRSCTINASLLSYPICGHLLLTKLRLLLPSKVAVWWVGHTPCHHVGILVTVVCVKQKNINVRLFLINVFNFHCNSIQLAQYKKYLPPSTNNVQLYSKTNTNKLE